jgi:adenosylmethionine-8-amino-7-oxononanoate aminotransferase
MEALRGGRGVRDVRSLGMMGGIEFHRDPAENRVGSESNRICKKVLNDGVWLRPLGDVIPVLPPVVLEDFEALFRVLASALDL